MLKRVQFDRLAPQKILFYGRMSSDQQNPRSIPQQHETVLLTIQRLGLPWTVAKTYEDAGITGQVLTKRKGLMQLLAEVKEGTAGVAILAVDTIERLSRSEQAFAVRYFFQKYGVCVVTADSEFRDPTTSDGQLLAILDTWRGQQENLVKGHMVSRGKRDAVLQGYWPGGTPPIGYVARKCETEQRGSRIVQRSRLVPDDATRIVVEKAFELADVRGWGTVQISKELNAAPTIPQDMKPIFSKTLDRILANPIYIGVRAWGMTRAGYLDDRWIVEDNPESEWVVVEKYCEPLVARDRFERVQQLAQARRAHWKARNVGDGNRRLPGGPVKYALSGLVVCGECGRAMAPTTRGETPAERFANAKFFCPHKRQGICQSRMWVPVAWLMAAVTEAITARLFPSADGVLSEVNLNSVAASAAFEDLVARVNAELAHLEGSEPKEGAALEQELVDLRRQATGFAKSLGNPDLDDEVRRVIESELGQLKRRQTEATSLLESLKLRRTRLAEVCSPEQVAEYLVRLHDLLSSENAMAANLELARVIDTVTVYPDGRVIIRLCKFGFVVPRSLVVSTICDETAEDAMPSETAVVDSMTAAEPSASRPMLGRRSRRQSTAPSADLLDPFQRSITSLEGDRFSHLGPEWFDEIELQVPVEETWPERNYEEAARMRLERPCDLETLAKHFGVSKPTLSRALKIAREHGLDTGKLDGRSLHSNWARDHALEVAEYIDDAGCTKSAAARHFEKSPATIRKALAFALEFLEGPVGFSERAPFDPRPEDSTVASPVAPKSMA